MPPSNIDPPTTPGRSRRRGSKERAATAARLLRCAIRLTVGGLTIAGLLAIGALIILSGSLSWTLGLLHHLAAVPYRAATHAGRTDVRHRALRLVLSEDRVAH